MRNVKGHIPLDLSCNLILFILYSYHSINSLPPPSVSSGVFLVHLSSANIFALLSFSDRQTDRHTDIQTQRYTDRQTDTHKNTKIQTYSQTYI